MAGFSRRSFLAGASVVAATYATQPVFSLASVSKSPFKVAVISDEISQDFDHACSIASKEFGLQG